MTLLWMWLACGEAPPVETRDACALLAAPAPGPLEDRRQDAASDPIAAARVFVEEARRTGDPGYYTLAGVAADCAISRGDADEAPRLLVHLDLQLHRFAEAEAAARQLVARPDAGWLDHVLLGDALLEQGRLDEAGDAYQRAVDLRPGLVTYERVAAVRYAWGDVDGAVEMLALAASAGSATDPEPLAWVLTRLGWLRALRGEPSPELDAALALIPDYPPARFARGRVRLFAGDRDGAAADLAAAGRTVEAVRALSEIDPAADVEAVRTQDDRGYALWVAPRDPVVAATLLDRELAARKDAMTRIARAWAEPEPRPDAVVADAKAALATGIAEPRALLLGGIVAGDRAAVERALASGPGLLPSERALGEAWIAGVGAP